MDITIRKATKEDMGRVHELIIELAMYEKLPQEVELKPGDLVNDGFGEKPLFHCFVAEVNSRVEAMAIFYNRYSTWKGKTVHLEDLIVTKNMRNKGIGALLLDRVIIFGKEMGVKRISWEVIDWNKKAIKFYQKKNVTFYFAGVKGPVRDDLFRSGILQIIDINHFFMRANQAVKFYKTGDRKHQEKFAKYIHQSYE